VVDQGEGVTAARGGESSRFGSGRFSVG
jgi:hypothetical protein